MDSSVMIGGVVLLVAPIVWGGVALLDAPKGEVTLDDEGVPRFSLSLPPEDSRLLRPEKI